MIRKRGVEVNEIITGYGILSGMKPKKSAKTSRIIRKKAIITVLLRRIQTLILQLRQEKEVQEAY